MADEAAQTYAVINSQGEVLFEFEGRISALGLILPEVFLGEPETPPAESTVEWQDAAKAQQELITAFAQHVPSTHYLESRAGPESGGARLLSSYTPKTASAGINAIAGGSNVQIIGSAGASNFAQLSALQASSLVVPTGTCTIRDQATGKSEFAQLSALQASSLVVPTGTCTIRDQASGKSEFLQLVSLANRKINFGVTTVTIAAQGGYANISHGLGVTPQVVLPVVANGAFQINAGADEYKSTTFRLGAYRTDGPNVGTTPFAWVAIG